MMTTRISSHVFVIKGIGQAKVPSLRFFSSASSTSGSETSPSVVLFQYAICPFCNITKAALAYASVDYKAVEVNPLTKSEIKWSKEYKKVPIATLDGEQLNGSDNIIKSVLDHPTVAPSLAEKLKSTSPEQFTSSGNSKEWFTFARDDLAALLYPNICRTWNDSYGAFSYVHDVDTFSSMQKWSIQNVGSLAMYFAASKIKQKRNITDERQAVNDLLEQLETEGLCNGRKSFVSGEDDPNLGDVALYGTLRSIEGLPTHEEVMKGRKTLSDWYARMKEEVGR